METIDNLYQQGLVHYIEALFSARHFEQLIVQAIDTAFNEDIKVRLTKELGATLTGGGHYANSASISQISNTTLVNYWSWIACDFWIEKPGIRLLIGFLYDDQKPSAVIALTKLKPNVRKELLDALNAYNHDLAEWDGAEIIIRSNELKIDGVPNDFTLALQDILEKFINFLIHKNQTTPNWLTTLI